MVKLEEHKHDTESKSIEKIPLPARVYIPLSQHLGKICEPRVQAGDSLFTGQKIAEAGAHVYSPVHASISGKVSSIQDWPHPVLGRCKTVVIDSDGLDSRPSSLAPRPSEEVAKFTSEQIRNIVFEAGIVGMGGASFPTHIKLNPPKPVDTLIINGAECEPYLTSDYRLMIEKTEEILRGITLIVRCLGVKHVYIAIEDNKPEAIEKFRVQSSEFRVKVLKSVYPQGGEKQLIKNILGKEVPSGKLPFDIGVVVHNVGTVFSIYEAAYLNKPLYERVVTVTGSCVLNPKNILARIGMPIKALIDFCGPLKEEPAKIIIGGPMMGIAQYTLDVPVIKSTTGVILLNEREAKARQEEFCIRCGACVRACPQGLMPCMINLASEKELWKEAINYRAVDCIECGLCNYVCPANRKLTQSIKRAKLEAVR
ncbi:MAG: electron transport complex subunit RsxC [Candidatus Omnitrophica bacterium]|nr:electron transport complex subunit RsxC [Candidatus Omnitrophota bacterium]